MTWFRTTLARSVLAAGLIGVAELVTRAGWINPVVLPRPSVIGRTLWDMVGTAQFGSNLARTAFEVGISCVVGIAVGLLIGAACARLPILGDSLEPYLASLYATPTLVFYPLLLAVMGLGSGPIIVITSGMVTVPVALNTMIGIREISPTLSKLARALNCGAVRSFRSIYFPAATPLVFPGIKLGTIYAIIGTIAMEFILANKGLGYQVGFDYNNFAIPSMWANIVAIVILASIAIGLLSFVETRIRRDLA